MFSFVIMAVHIYLMNQKGTSKHNFSSMSVLRKWGYDFVQVTIEIESEIIFKTLVTPSSFVRFFFKFSPFSLLLFCCFRTNELITKVGFLFTQQSQSINTLPRRPVSRLSTLERPYNYNLLFGGIGRGSNFKIKKFDTQPAQFPAR